MVASFQSDDNNLSSSLSRLVDYFVVVGLDEKKERNGNSVGKILQRFPQTDWPDVPFFSGLELFCQPEGWKLHAKFKPPAFFVSVLTDIGADRHYVACLSFFESRFPWATGDQSDLSPLDDEPNSVDDSSLALSINDLARRETTNVPFMYSPKCLILVSRHCYFEVFKNCLATIYTVYIDKLSFEFETLVANLVSGIYVPPAGGPQIKFSLGANDRQFIQTPKTLTVPVTNNSIALLFQQLGIYNVVCLFSAVLTDRKILFLSQSCSRLTEACHALSCLIFPLKYSYVYVPLLPGSLTEVLHSPTPFIMGLHSSFKSHLTDLTEVVYVDLDNGSIFVPDGLTIPPLPEPYGCRLSTALTLVLNKELFTADFAFQSGCNRNVPLTIVDKQIRACFLRLFADIFTDYRFCLRVVRIYPKPYIAFHKAAFMGLRGFQEDEFMSRLLDSMSFQAFITERGPPYRTCDIFDEICCNFDNMLKDENENIDKIMDNIVVLAQQLQENECPDDQSVFLNNVPQPSDVGVKNTVPHSFPTLDASRVDELIDVNIAKFPASLNILPLNNQRRFSSPLISCREVPCVKKRPSLLQLFSSNVRRLDVLKSCLKFIFDNKISDARKMFSAVLLSMKSPIVRVCFCQELHSGIKMLNRATLEAQQFDLIVRLMNCALQNDTAADEFGVAYAMLSLASVYCRRLSTGVMQFAYTCIQDHPVWKNQQFWESSFFHDVHCELKNIYTPGGNAKRPLAPFGTSPSRDVWNFYEQPSTLCLTAEKMKTSTRIPEQELQDLKQQEEAIIFSQAIHYANRIVYFLVPMDANRLRRVNVRSLEENSSASVSNMSSNHSADENESTTESDVESGFLEGDNSGNRNLDLGEGTVRFISKFLDKVCCDARLGAERLRQLHLMVPGVVAMQIETLENVHKESKKLPPIHKPRMLVPTFLPGEQMLQGYLRVYLLPDGRADWTPKTAAEKMHSNSFLPAEGAIFLTTYRIIFIGQPCDPYTCDKIVMRVIPVMSMTKQKRIGHQILNLTEQGTTGAGGTSGGHYLHDVLQIRSSTFQLMKIAFDEEVSSDKVQNFCQTLDQLRWPEEIWQIFALAANNAGQTGTYSALMLGMNAAVLPKDKTATIKGMAKAAWRKTAKKAGFAKDKPKTSKTLSSGHPAAIGHQFGGTLTPRRTSPDENAAGNDATLSGESSSRINTNLSRTLDRLSERSYCQDYQRLGLCSKVEVTLHSGSTSGAGTLSRQLTSRTPEGVFRLSVENRTYGICRSYPSVLCVPTRIKDESLKKLAKGHKHGRFPVVTWRSQTGALLLHGSGFHVRNVVSRWKQQASHQSTASSNFNLTAPDDTSSSLQLHKQQNQVLKSSLEQERYFSQLVALSPQSSSGGIGFRSGHSLSDSMGSLLSLDSLLLANFDAISLSSTNTPDLYRKPLLGVQGSLQKAMGAMRSSQGAGQSKSMTMRFGLRPGFQGRNHQKASSSSAAGAGGSGSSSTIMAPRFLSANTVHQKRLSVSSNISDVSSIYSTTREATVSQTLHRASLYIFGEKSQAKVLKLDQRCEFIPIDYPSSHEAKESFKKLLRVAAPATIVDSSSSSSTHLKNLDESGWLQQIKSLLQISNAVVDLVDLQNSSVAICLEYGWDATIQIISLAELMLDPFYRTIEGFRTLIEKEWLSFGHRFSHRCNHTLLSSSSGFAPIFLQFLDAVHQIHQQFPAEFEFNDFYLRFLAYHSTATYFRTFLLDCEADRIESGLTLQSDWSSNKPSRYRTDALTTTTTNQIESSEIPFSNQQTGGVSPPNNVGERSPAPSAYQAIKQRSSSLNYHQNLNMNSAPGNSSPNYINLSNVWDFVAEKNKRSSIFHNFFYNRKNTNDAGDSKVLRPKCALPFLDLWDFYTADNLASGSIYDNLDCNESLDTFSSPSQSCENFLSSKSPILSDDSQDQAVTFLTDNSNNARRLIDLNYESVDFSQPPVFKSMLDAVFTLEKESDLLPQNWEQILSKIRQNVDRQESNKIENVQNGPSFLTWSRWLNRTQHKRSTLELLLKGRTAGRQQQRISHNLDQQDINCQQNSTKNSRHVLQKFSFSMPENCSVCNRVLWDILKQGYKCSMCNFCCHEKCAASAPASCSGSGVHTTRAASNVSEESLPSPPPPAIKFVECCDFENFIAEPVETRTHEGYLMKRGALLKAWKQRWFVLDSIKHELRYYELMEDSHCKGCIDLSEVSAIGSVAAPPGSPKTIEGAFFELKTARRVYNFMANNQKDAHEWIEKIQACLQ